MLIGAVLTALCRIWGFRAAIDADNSTLLFSEPSNAAIGQYAVQGGRYGNFDIKLFETISHAILSSISLYTPCAVFYLVPRLIACWLGLAIR